MKRILMFSVLIWVLLLGACGDESNVVKTNGDSSSNEQIAQYTCAMHPHYISTDSEGSCPICGMDLVPVQHDDNKPQKADDIIVSVSQEMIQTMSVRTSPAKVVEFSRTLRAFGTVEANERLESVSVSRIEGWVENLRVSAEADSVNNGDLLYEVYSPELISAQRDYLNALATRNIKRIGSVKQRLTSIGMQDQVLRELAQSKKIIERVPVYAEADGFVLELNVRNGDYVKPGKPMLRLQSYASVWVIASIPETDLSLIETGVFAALRFPSAPKAPPNGQINHIYPTIDPKTRTAKVRIEVENFSGQLLPGAYADITLEFPKKPRLSIVSEALLRDSRGEHVILALGQGRFVSRAVVTGVSVNGRTEITQGLDEGDNVVASGQFMLDSEVNLREGLLKLSSSAGDRLLDQIRSKSEMPTSQSAPLSQLKLGAEELAEFDHFVDSALYLYESVINDKPINVAFLDPAIALADSLKASIKNDEFASILNESQRVLRAAKLTANEQVPTQELAQLVQAISPWLLSGAPEHYRQVGLTLFQEVESGRFWLQNDSVAANPYSADSSVRVTIIDWPMGSNATPSNVDKATPKSSQVTEAHDHAEH